MTSKVPYVKLYWDHIEWNPLHYEDGKFYCYWNYIYWWNPLSKKSRYWGYSELDYDCQPHRSFGFWFFNISWCFG